MKAAVIRAGDGDGVIDLEERPTPEPGHGEVLVRVVSSALNRADLLQRRGRYPAPTGWPAEIPGLEFAGVVAATGAGASRWRPGDRVMGLVGGGAHAEYLVTHQDAVARVPAELSWEQAGAAPEACITAHDALDSLAALVPGERVVVHAAGSGVGLAAVQIAQRLGARVFATARGAAKRDAALSHGAERAIGPDAPGWLARAVDDWSGGAGADVILDLVGGDYVAESVGALAMHGRLILIGTVAGREGRIDLARVLSRRLTIRGTVLRSRPLAERIDLTERFARLVVPWLAAGAVSMPIDSGFPLTRIADAHRRLETGDAVGKVAIRIDG